MQREATIPSEFAHLNVQYVQRKSPTEYSSTCPECGGAQHQNGEWPDRFVMFLDQPNARGWCRKCGYFVWADGEARKLSKEEQLIRKEIEEKVLEDQRRRIDARLTQIREDKAWLRWHIEMDEQARASWYKRGLLDPFIDYWKLGFDPHYITSSGFVTSSLTIPCFSTDWQPTQIYHRLSELPPGEGGKYRQTKGLRPALFIADPDYFLNEQVIIAEGQIKTQVGFKALLDHDLEKFDSIEHNGLNMVGIPSVEPNIDIFEPIKNAKRVYLVLDPDSRQPNKATGRVAQPELIKKLKQQYEFEIYTIDLYDKLDDYILRLGLGAKWWAGRLRRAVRV